VSATASRHAGIRPVLDAVSRQAVDQARTAETPQLPDPHSDGQDSTDDHRADNAHGDPEAILWAALSLAPDEGVSVPDLMDATQMSRPWVYQRLREMADRGQVAQVGRGRWRAVTEHPQ